MNLDDTASEVEHLHREAALRGRVTYTGISPINCTECDEQIEEARRFLLAGTTYCASCAQIKEQQEKRK